MAYFLTYQTSFEEKVGTSNTELWRISIYEDRASAPSEVGSLILNSDEPFSIEYFTNDDIFYPIRGSRCKVNLLVTEDTSYSSFYTGGVREWEVRIDYRESGEWKDYWRGFIVPEEYEETIGVLPFPISFSATDGLSLLQDETYAEVEEEGEDSVFEFIRQQLKQTGLDLNIHVESGFTTGTAGIDLSDAMLSSTINRYVWYDNGVDDRAKRFDILKECLSAFNCRVYQRKGAWFITNNSSVPDNVTFESFDADGTSIANISESLVSTVPTELIPISDNFKKIYKQPYRSVECNIINQNPVIYNSNPYITHGDDFLDGYTFPNTSTFPKATSTAQSFIGDRSITSSVVKERGDDVVWFKLNPFTISETQKYYKVKVTYKVLVSLGANAESALIRNRIYYRQTGENNQSYWTWAFEGADANGNPASEVSPQWHFRGNISDKKAFIGESKIDTTTSWQTVEIEVNQPRSGVGGTNTVEFGVDFLGTVPLKSNDAYGGTATTYIDDIRVEALVEQSGEATYELVNDSAQYGNKTYEYETRLHSQNNVVFYGGLSQTAFRRGSLTAQSLERGVTQQILNDFRDNGSYFEGMLLKDTDSPLHFGDKIKISFDNYTESTGSIIDSLKLNPIKGTYMIQAHTPNQGTDVTATLHDYDVELSSPDFKFRSDAALFDLTIDLTNVTLPSDASDSATIDDYITLNLPKVLDDDNNEEVGKYQLKKYFINSGELQEYSIIVTPNAGFEINASNFSIRNTDDDPRPDEVTNSKFEDLGIPMTIDLQITSPDYPSSGTIVIDGEVDALTAGTVSFGITEANTPTGTTTQTFTSGTIPLGGGEVVIAYVTPTDATKEILTHNSAAPTVVAYDADDNVLDNVIGDIVELQHNTGVSYQFTVSYRSDLDDITITYGAVTLTDIPSGTTTSVINCTASEGNWTGGGQSIDDTGNWSIEDTSVSVQQVVGTPFRAIFEVKADPNRWFVLDGVDAEIDDEDSDTDGVQNDIDNFYVLFKSHREYHVIVEGNTPSAPLSNSSITIRALTDDKPPVEASVVTFNKGDDPTGVTVTNPENQAGVIGTTEAVVYYISPTSQDRYISTTPTPSVTDANNVADTANATMRPLGSGWIYTLPFTYPSVDRTVSVTFSNATVTNINTDTQLAQTTTTITATKTATGGSPVSTFAISDTSLKIKTTEGDVVYLGPLQVEAASGYILSAQPTIGGDSETYITPSGYSYEYQKISDYEWHVYIPVLIGSSDQNGNVTVAVTTSDDDGEEINHTIIVPSTAGSNTTVTLNSGTNELEIDPGDTGFFTVTVEGLAGYDVSGITMNATLPSWIVEEGIEDYLVDDGLTTGRRFTWKITGQDSPPSDFTMTFTGTPTQVEAYKYVMTIDSSDSANMKTNKNVLSWTYPAGHTGTLPSRTFTVESADSINQYDNDNDVSTSYTIEDAAGSVATGTMSISESRNGGVFTYTVVPTVGTSFPADGTYDGVITLTENTAPLVAATSASWAVDKAVATSGETIKVAFTADGNVVATEGETWISSPSVTFTDRTNGYVTIPTSSLSSGKRTGTVYLKVNSSDSNDDALDSLTVVQEATGTFVQANNYTITKTAGASYAVFQYTNTNGTLVSDSITGSSVTVCSQTTPVAITGASVGAAGAACGSGGTGLSGQLYIVASAPSSSDSDGIYFVT